MDIVDFDNFDDMTLLEKNLDYFEKFLTDIKSIDESRRMLIDEISRTYEVDEIDPGICSFLDEKVIDYKRLKKKICKIKEKVHRQQIKIAMFGRVSVGKSKILNSLLGGEIFPSASAHTTSCFVRVERSQCGLHWLEYRDCQYVFPDLKELVEEVDKKTSKLNEESSELLEINETMSVYLNLDCKILQPGTVIVDTPGSGNKEEITNLLKTESLDADIFIFVISNALTDADRIFFEYQSQYSSRPDIFILVNGWDNSDSDGRRVTDKSRKMIKDECEKFLIRECALKAEDADKRIFFISAQEMLSHRMGKKDLMEDKTRHRDKKLERKKEFEQFEQDVLDYILNPEQNKVRRHVDEIQKINEDLLGGFQSIRLGLLSLRTHNDLILDNMGDILVSISEFERSTKTYIDEKIDELIRFVDDKFDHFLTNYHNNNRESLQSNINSLVSDIQTKSSTFSSELKERLDNQKNEYNSQLGEFKVKQKKTKPTLSTTFNSNLGFRDSTVNTTAKNVVKAVGTLIFFLPTVWTKIGGFVIQLGSDAIPTTDNNIEEENRQKIRDRKNEIAREIQSYSEQLQEYVSNWAQTMTKLTCAICDSLFASWRDIKETIEEYRLTLSAIPGNEAMFLWDMQ